MFVPSLCNLSQSKLIYFTFSWGNCIVVGLSVCSVSLNLSMVLILLLFLLVIFWTTGADHSWVPMHGIFWKPTSWSDLAYKELSFSWSYIAASVTIVLRLLHCLLRGSENHFQQEQKETQSSFMVLSGSKQMYPFCLPFIQFIQKNSQF
jgi:hypothetical protein